MNLERRYQCIGQWTENNIIYTYAKRLDVPTYECFLGALASPEEIFIKEAGEHCRRDIDPYRYSMQLNKTNACPKMETKIDVPPSHEFDEKEKSSTATPDEMAPSSNGEIEYEYIEENHLNINGNAVSSSTDSKVQVHVKEGVGDNQNTIDNSVAYQSIHPKLNIGVATKINNKTSTQNKSYSQLSDLTLISILLSLSLLMPNLFIH